MQLQVLQHGPVHERLMDTVYDFMDDCNSKVKSIRLALRANRYVFEDYLSPDEENDGSEDINESDNELAEHEECK
jgi:hypothetical protein